jgi:hypothetical protein
MTNVTPSTTSMAVAILLRYPGAGLGGSVSAASLTGLHLATLEGEPLICPGPETGRHICG